MSLSRKKTRRGKIEIYEDILHLIERKGGACLKTHLMYQTNLSFSQLQEYLHELEDLDLIEIKKSSFIVIYMTERGVKALSAIRNLRKYFPRAR